MKRVLLILIAFFAILQACSSDETLDGKWIAKDIDLEMEVSCECPEEEKARIKELFNEGMEQEMNRVKASYYYIFKPDHTVISSEEGNQKQGTYKLKGDDLIITYKNSDHDEITEVIREGDETTLSSTLSEEELSKMTEVIEHPQYGTVKISFSDMNILLEKSTQE